MTPRLFLLCGLILFATLFGSAEAADSVDFAKQVAPVLATRCAGCHDGLEKKGGLDLTQRATLLAGGESGPALVTGDVDKSLLWQRIAADEMPPKHPLPVAERAILKTWIQQGAPWQGGTLDPLAFTSDQRAGYDWWSLQPVQLPHVPPLSKWARTPIDAFVEQRLSAAKLTPSPAAPARTLIRRMFFDLIGLPPSHEELANWETKLNAESQKQGSADLRTSAAFSSPLSALVDDLLARPQYGERWARHWLDVARFGESQGFERDRLRTNSWRYRDWVIAALNRDLPYDEFARLQLAGDVLQPGNPDALIATGFLVAAPWDEVGHKQQSAAMRAVVRQDELEDLVGTVGQTFLGLTVNCSRCHDHKFDPIRQREYYQLCAALSGVRHGEPPLSADHAASLDSQRAPLDQRLKAVQARLMALEQPHRERILAARRQRRERLTPPKPIAAWDFQHGLADTVGDLDLELVGDARLEDGLLRLAGNGYAVSSTMKRALGEKTLEVAVQLANLDQRGGGAMSIEMSNGDRFDAIVYGEREPRRWLPGSEGFSRTKNVEGELETATKSFVQVAIAYQTDGNVTVYRNGLPYGATYKSRELHTFKANATHVLLGLRHLPAQPGKMLQGAIKLARLYDRALGADEIAASAGVESTAIAERDLLAALSEAERSERDDLRFEAEQLVEALDRVADRKVYAVAAQSPEPTHVLHRGNPNDPREQVSAAAIASLVGDRSQVKPLALDATDAERRRWLAAWITSRDNPLFARVIVNRLWQHHFGLGLVDTPNDFGFNGGRPSHPELLDWLAHELMTHNWS
ncbi:MAG: DUF1549 domain-containing protein, partial [Planctomycetaceae bacterium]|nr:DUF1549 domain-containing protein [Planctomycetaceae bacterium]